MLGVILAMKKRDAFAFRDFDEQRILQRPFFKAFKFDADKSDDEILQSLSLSDDDSLSALKEKNRALRQMFDRLSEFVKFTLRHSERLRRYYRGNPIQIERTQQLDIFYSNKIKRARKLDIFYSINAAPAAGELERKVLDFFIKSEKALQKKSREFFAERLKEARIKAGLSRRYVADELNLLENSYGFYERGLREPNIMMLLRLANLLNVSADWLIGIAP